MSAASQPARDLIPEPLAGLDAGTSLPLGWITAVRSALEALTQALGAEDQAILTHVAAYRPGAHAGPATSGGVALEIDSAAKDELPVAAALLAWRRARAGPALTCLTAVLMNLALGPEGQDRSRRNQISELARIIRNANEKRGANLRVLIAGSTTVSSLLQVVDQQIENGSELHLSFNSLWTKWLRHRVARWIMADPVRRLELLGPPAALLVDIDAERLPLWSGEGGDDQIELAGTEISGPAFEGLGKRSTHSLATSHLLLRRSGEVPLALHPDHLVPDGLIRGVATAALAAGQAAVAAGNREHAEPFLALAFQIASGLRETDLALLKWGASDDQADSTLLIGPSALAVRVKRPPNAVEPSNALRPFLKATTDILHWPLPPSLHAALKGMSSGEPEAGAVVFQMAGTPARYRLRDVVADLLPGAQFGASRFRLALAASLADRIGPEGAQLAMRDSFSTSLGAAYYTAIPEQSIARAISRILQRWFGEQAPWETARHGRIGSRLVLKDDLAQAWPRTLRRNAYSAARQKGGWRSSLKSERNLLAAALCAATGVRPGRCVGSLLIDSVVPEYGLVVLEDKLTDVLRRTRVAVTGRRWAAAFRRYLERLIELMDHDEESVAQWATGVLTSELPLFSLPREDGQIEFLEMGELVTTMPRELRDVPNHYRHRLNQRLQEKGVDWELRFAQMGWVVTPSYALAELSPLSACLMGERLAEIIDGILVEDGWFTKGQRVPRWSWAGVPERPWKDWSMELRRYEAEHEIHKRGIREAFVARRSEIEEQILPRLASAIDQLVPALKLDLGSRTLVAAVGFGQGVPVPLSPEHYILLRECIRRDDHDPSSALELLAAEHLIHELVKKAIKEKLVAGPEPPRRHLGVTADLSPFLPGMGLAVRHAEALRSRLVEIAAANRAHDRPGVALLHALASTPYRDLQLATAAVGSAGGALRGMSRREYLTVPATLDGRESPLVFAGPGAALLARRRCEAPTARPLGREQLNSWVHKRFDGVLCPEAAAENLIEPLVATLRMAGRLELSGPERLVMERHPAATVGATRSLAIADHWPIRTEWVDGSEQAAGWIKEREPSERGEAANAMRATYRKLTAALNSDVSRRNLRRRSDGKHRWRGNLKAALGRLAEEVGDDTNLWLLIRYVSYRLRHGGRSVAKLSQGTLHKEITRFASALIDLLGDRSLLWLDGEDIQSVYLAVLCNKPPASRPDVLEEISKFHHYLESAHHVAGVDFAPLREFCGRRVRRPAPGAYSDAEVESVLTELEQDLERERTRLDASPEDTRVCKLRIMAFLILEASGIRPASVHGLVLGDLHLLGGGDDFVHVHRTGEYGAAKTRASVGFIRLEGEVWLANRKKLLNWLDEERSILGATWWKQPLFADAVGSRRRFHGRHITDRIAQLLRWASGDRKAQVYWLRKRRITIRMRRALTRPSAAPRDVHRALCESGHTGIRTTIGHYIHDPAVPVSTYLRLASKPDRSMAIAVSGLPAAPLDQAWHRSRLAGRLDFYGAVLDQLGVQVTPGPEIRMTDPPELYRQKGLSPSHIDTYARALHESCDRTEAMALSGLSSQQAEILEEAACELLVNLGAAPWPVAGVRQRRGVMPPARHLDGTEALFALLDGKSFDLLDSLIRAWLEQRFIHRLHDENVVLLLKTDEQQRAASQLISSTRIEFEISETRQGEHALIASGSGAARRKTQVNSLRWLLTMHWLFGRLAARST